MNDRKTRRQVYYALMAKAEEAMTESQDTIVRAQAIGRETHPATFKLVSGWRELESDCRSLAADVRLGADMAIVRSRIDALAQRSADLAVEIEAAARQLDSQGQPPSDRPTAA